MGAFYIAIVMVMRVVQNYYNKRGSLLLPSTARGRYRYLAVSMCLSALPALVLLLIDRGEADWMTVGIAAVSGVALALAILCGQLIMQTGTMVLNTVFSTAGLIVPCLCGVLFFGEHLSPWQWAGIVLFIPAAVLLSHSAGEANAGFSMRTMWLCLTAFLLNGITMVCQKLLTFYNERSNVSLFSFCTFALPAVIFALLSLGVRQPPHTQPERFHPRLWIPLILTAGALFVINQLSTIATVLVPSAVLFVCTGGGNVIVAAVVGALFFGEKPTWRMITGLILGVGSLVVVNTL